MINVLTFSPNTALEDKCCCHTLSWEIWWPSPNCTSVCVCVCVCVRPNLAGQGKSQRTDINIPPESLPHIRNCTTQEGEENKRHDCLTVGAMKNLRWAFFFLAFCAMVEDEKERKKNKKKKPRNWQWRGSHRGVASMQG